MKINKNESDIIEARQMYDIITEKLYKTYVNIRNTQKPSSLCLQLASLNTDAVLT